MASFWNARKTLCSTTWRGRGTPGSGSAVWRCATSSPLSSTDHAVVTLIHLPAHLAVAAASRRHSLGEMARSPAEVGLPTRCPAQEATLRNVGITAHVAEEGKAHAVPESVAHHAANLPSHLLIQRARMHGLPYQPRYLSSQPSHRVHLKESEPPMCQDATELATAATEDEFMATQCGDTVPFEDLTGTQRESLGVAGPGTASNVTCLPTCGSTSHAPS